MAVSHTRAQHRSRSLDGDDLVLSHFSLARDHPIDDRIRSASAAGFAGIGLYAGQYRQLLNDGITAASVRDLLDEWSISIAEVEALSGWGAAVPTDSYHDFEAVAWEMVDEFESRYVQAIGPYEGTPRDAAIAFGALCDRAADHGAIVGLEFLPFTNIVDANDALAIVEDADRPNGGVCVDIWHHARGARDIEQIRRIPPELIVGIQMSDGPLDPVNPDYKDDCLRNRVAPGEGAFDVVGFVTTLLEIGANVPWSLEVCNDAVWGHPGGDHAARAAAAMRRVLATCRARTGMDAVDSAHPLDGRTEDR
jgi:sugar phosphate isomerase/epimerase